MSLNSFNFITSTFERIMIENAFEAITLTEHWDFMKKDQINYQFCVLPEIQEITEKMIELGYDGHSGASFEYVMSIMHYIANNGLEHYKIKYLLANKRN